MAKKKDKKPGLTGGDILIAALIALAGGTAAFLVILIGGSLLAPDFGKNPTADQPPAVSQTVRGTLPSRAPAPTPTPAPEPTEPPEEPSNDPEPEQTAEPVQQTAEPTAKPSQAPPPAQTRAPAPAQTRAPAATPSRAPAQNPGPVVSINPTVPPVRQTQAPTQSGNQSGGGGPGNADNFYAHDNPNQQNTSSSYVLNTSTMKFHYPSCNDVRRIASQNYATSNQTRQQIMERGYSPCGHCNP